MLIRHEQILLAQAQQSAACNVSHSIEARLSRWLLWTRELSGSDTLGLTQEFLAQMLGVRRTSVSLVANTLQNAGLIRYRRGRIEITDLEGLRAASCECYGRVKMHYDRLLGDCDQIDFFFCREPDIRWLVTLLGEIGLRSRAYNRHRTSSHGRQSKTRPRVS